jgi:hypothetical protein
VVGDIEKMRRRRGGLEREEWDGIRGGDDADDDIPGSGGKRMARKPRKISDEQHMVRVGGLVVGFRREVGEAFARRSSSAPEWWMDILWFSQSWAPCLLSQVTSSRCDQSAEERRWEAEAKTCPGVNVKLT